MAQSVSQAFELLVAQSVCRACGITLCCEILPLLSYDCACIFAPYIQTGSNVQNMKVLNSLEQRLGRSNALFLILGIFRTTEGDKVMLLSRPSPPLLADRRKFP